MDAHELPSCSAEHQRKLLDGGHKAVLSHSPTLSQHRHTHTNTIENLTPGRSSLAHSHGVDRSLRRAESFPQRPELFRRRTRGSVVITGWPRHAFPVQIYAHKHTYAHREMGCVLRMGLLQKYDLIVRWKRGGGVVIPHRSLVCFQLFNSSCVGAHTTTRVRAA